MEYLVFAGGVVIFGAFCVWALADSALDARRNARLAASSGAAAGSEVERDPQAQ